MKERIREVQKASGLTQVDFGQKIGISRAGVQKLVSGENNPSEQTIRAICNVFNINRQWLETGEGEMIDPRLDDDMDAMMAIMHGQSESKKELFRILAAMPDELLDLVLDYLRSTKKAQ